MYGHETTTHQTNYKCVVGVLASARARVCLTLPPLPESSHTGRPHCHTVEFYGHTRRAGVPAESIGPSYAVLSLRCASARLDAPFPSLPLGTPPFVTQHAKHVHFVIV